MNSSILIMLHSHVAKLFMAAALWGLTPWTMAQIDHGLWDELMTKHVRVLRGGQASGLDYAGVRLDRGRLGRYLSQLSAVSREDFDNWGLGNQLAFLINTYNAWTVELILQQEPDLTSIRDIGFLPNAAWRRKIVKLFGAQVSLDEIEHGMIRGWGRYNEPRIHFAVNCAAVGCPALRNEAFTGSRLEEQLEEATRLFLSDQTRNYRDGNRLYISPLFDWYKEDFEQGWSGINSVPEFLASYAEQLGLSEDEIIRLGSERSGIRYSYYDWRLNRIP